jgi:hypothetical protein
MAANTSLLTMTTASEKGQALTKTNSFLSEAFRLLEKVRGIPGHLIQAELSSQGESNDWTIIADALLLLSSALRRISKDREAGAIDQVLEKAVDRKAFGGLGLRKKRTRYV